MKYIIGTKNRFNTFKEIGKAETLADAKKMAMRMQIMFNEKIVIRQVATTEETTVKAYNGKVEVMNGNCFKVY